MKLNLHILLDVLETWGFQGNLPDNPTDQRCSYPMLCHSFPAFFSEDVLYIINADLLPPNANAPKHTSILCVGTPPLAWLHVKCNFLYTLHETLSASELMNIITAQFYRYQAWEHELQEALNTHQSFQKMALVAGKLINNPLEVWESTIYLVCYNLPEMEQPTQQYIEFKSEHPWKTDYIMDEETLQNLISDDEYNLAHTKKEPTIYSGKPEGFRTLYYNIFFKETLIARICISEIINTFKSRDFALIKIFGDILAKGMIRNGVYSFRQHKKFLEVLKGLVSHRLQPEPKINQFLLEYHWDMFDEYICMVIKSKFKVKNPSSNLGPLAIELSKLMPCSSYVTHSDHLVFICNLTQTKKSREHVYNQVLPFLRDSLLSASISTCFYCFKELYYYYQQALIASDIGEKKDPTKWYFKFEDYQTDYLLQQYQGKLHKKALIPGGLYRLIEYDQSKGTNYAETLRIYLENSCNTQKTTQQLFLHRNSLSYRINRIEEILSMDLESANNRLILQLAFRLLKI